LLAKRAAAYKIAGKFAQNVVFEPIIRYKRDSGAVAERLKATVLKTVLPVG
jgi:hypothetical protein